MALSNDSIPPSTYELRVRFACGFVVGVILGLRTALWHGDPSPMAMLLSALGGGLGVGVLARHYGDRFWHVLHRAVFGWRYWR